MGLRYILCLIVIEACLWQSEAIPQRERRQINNNFPEQPKPYQPPISLGAPSAPVSASASIQNSYQPPISLIQSNEYQSPLNHPQNPYPANAPRSYQPPVPQTYVLPNQHQHQSHSVQYIPPTNIQQSFSVYQQPAPNSVPQPATSFSVQQQPPQSSQSFAIVSSGLPHSTAERTYSTHSKVVASSHVPAQAIHKAPASEIQSDKGSVAKEKDNKNDEYVVYYYYYYDNDTSANNNLSLNFDDIPSLEGYDNDKLAKEPEKSASARTLSANFNSLTPVPSKSDKDASTATENIASQPRSVGDVYGHSDRSNSNPLVETVVQPLKPVSNVFRYGSNEVPRFPVLPNFIVTEVPTTLKPEISTPDTLTTEPPTTQSSQINAQPDLKTSDDADDDDLNNVLDNGSDLKHADDKAEEEPTTTTTTTTTEPPTTTEEPTTTEKPTRRRPSLGGGSRRRFNPSPSSSFSSNRSRQTPNRSTSSTSTTTTTTTTPPTRRSFQGNRIRPRPSIGSNRPPRPGSRSTEAGADENNKPSEATTASTTTTTSRSRFTSSSAPRRFQSSRSRSQTSSTTSTTTTRAPSAGGGFSSRSRPPTSRPRPNLITRNRPPRPGFPSRARPGSELEVPETTTTAPPPSPTEDEETSPETASDDLPSTNDESNETEEDEETSEEETEEPTTTEGSRFSALFRPRNRNALGNRPRPVIGNRPSRS